MYDNPEDYSESEEAVRERCLDRALQLAKARSSDDERSDMSDNDVKEAASKFEEFIDG